MYWNKKRNISGNQKRKWQGPTEWLIPGRSSLTHNSHNMVKFLFFTEIKESKTKIKVNLKIWYKTANWISSLKCTSQDFQEFRQVLKILVCFWKMAEKWNCGHFLEDNIQKLVENPSCWSIRSSVLRIHCKNYSQYCIMCDNLLNDPSEPS